MAALTDSSQRSFGTKLLDLYLYSSLHIGICAFTLALFGFVIHNSIIDWNYAFCVGSATIGLYCLHRLVGISKVEKFENEGRFKIIKLYKTHIWKYFAISSFASLFLFLQLDWEIQRILLFIGIVCLAYAIPILGGKRIRDFHYVKILIIAIIWPVLCITIPGYVAGIDLGLNIILSTSMFLFFIGITIPFDIRDMEVDRSINVKTIATQLGVKKSKLLSSILIILSFVIILISHYNIGAHQLIGTWLLASVVTLYMIHRLSNQKKDVYYTLLLDGTIMLFFIGYKLLNLLY
jgi:4-hydroxybenzoate polyprenyltransferase